MPKDGTQGSWDPLVCFDLERVPGHPSVRGAGVNSPLLAPFASPVPAEVIDGLAHVVGHNMDMGVDLGPTHADIPQLPAATIGEQVGGVEGGPLAAVHGCRVTVGEAVGGGLFGAEGVSAPVVHADSKVASVQVDRDDPTSLGGD